MSDPVEPPIPDAASTHAAPVEPSSAIPTMPNPSGLGLSPQSGSGSRSFLAILLPIILMVLSLAGIGATLLVANHQASAAPSQGSGQFPGGNGQFGQNGGQRPSGFPSGVRPSDFPSGYPSGGNFASGYPSGGRARPSGFPTDGSMPSGFPTGGNFQGGGFPGGNGGYQRNGQPPSQGMHLSGLEIGLISALGVIFVGSAVFLVIGLAGRRKPAAGSHS